MVAPNSEFLSLMLLHGQAGPVFSCLLSKGSTTAYDKESNSVVAPRQQVGNKKMCFCWVSFASSLLLSPLFWVFNGTTFQQAARGESKCCYGKSASSKKCLEEGGYRLRQSAACDRKGGFATIKKGTTGRRTGKQ